jgi:hypothetical protein
VHDERATRPDQQAVDAAISRVLAVERRSRDAIDACRREAEAIVSEAGSAASAVQNRLETRLRAAHAIADRGIERALDALRKPMPRDDEERLAPPAVDLDAVIQRLARELTSSEMEAGDDA